MENTERIVYIIEKDRQFLSFVRSYKGQVYSLFTPYKYDAVMIKKAGDARLVARKIGGSVLRFNRLDGEIKVIA